MQPADIDETPLAGEGARECAERLARDKALRVAQRFPGELVLGADTVVVVEGSMLAKPVDRADAARMLRMLSGRDHFVITGVCLAQGANPASLRVGSATTRVTVSAISDREIEEYVASGEPMDKAGAYAIQGMASRWIPRIDGDYSNVVGLPVALVYRMLREVREAV